MSKSRTYFRFRLQNSSFLLFFITSFFSSLIRSEPAVQLKKIEPISYVHGVEPINYLSPYFKNNQGSLYARISPYYLHQLTDSSCSLASATIIINALRSPQLLKGNQAPVSQHELLTRVNDSQWCDAVKQGGNGVTLDQFKLYLEKALQVSGIEHYTIEIKRMDKSELENRLSLHQSLIESETTGKTFIIANFNQKFFTGTLSVGHFSPVGAYDKITKRVLILDTDSELHEPYWVPEKLLLDSMSTPDTDSGHYRGYIVIKTR